MLEYEQMNATVLAAVVGGVALLLGAALTYLGQFLQTKKEHKWALEAAKRDAYAEFLRSISASYAQAKSEAKSRQGHESETKSSQTESHRGRPRRATSQRRSLLRPEKPQGPSQESHKKEEADLRAATARIVLLAKQHIYKEAMEITDRAIEAHDIIRSVDPTAEDAKEAEEAVNSRREALIKQFKKDLGIPSGDQQSRIKRFLHAMAGQVDQRR
jgi:hypothetical protein